MQLAFTAGNAVCAAVVAQKDKVLAMPIVSNHSEAVCAAASAVSGAVKDPKGAMNAVKDSLLSVPISHLSDVWISQRVSFSCQSYWLHPHDGSVRIHDVTRCGDLVFKAENCVGSVASAVQSAMQNPKACLTNFKNTLSAAVITQKDKVLTMPILARHSEAASSAASAVLTVINDAKTAVNVAKTAVSSAVVAQKDKVLAMPIVSNHSEAVCAAASAVSGAVKDPKGAMIAAQKAVSSAVVAQKDKVLAMPIVSNHSEAVCAAASAVSGAVKDPKGAMNAVKEHVVVQRVVKDPLGSISEASRSSIVFVSNVSAAAYIATMQKLQARRQQLAADFPGAASHFAAAQHRIISIAAPVVLSMRAVVAPAPIDQNSQVAGLATSANIVLSDVRSKVSSVVEKANAVRSYYTTAAVCKGQNYAFAVTGSAISVAQSIIRTIDSADVVVDGLVAMIAQKVIDDRDLLAEYVLSLF
jgi:hypothetical protein